MDDKCKSKLSPDQLQDLRWRTYWIAGREYYRTVSGDKAAEAMKAWDAIAAKAHPDHKFNDGNSDLNAFLLKLRFPQWMPGWNDADCSFSQTEFACFCSYITDMDAAKRNPILSQIASSNAPVDFFCDSAVVEDDPIYKSSFPGPKGSGKTSMWPWLVGLGAIGVVGAAIFVDQKKLASKGKKNPGYNPSKKVKPFTKPGNYLTLIGTENGNLILRPTREGKKEAKELLENRDDHNGIIENESHMLEDHITNSDWDWIRPEEVGALTDGTMIGSEVERDDHGEFVMAKRVYAHMNYAVEDPTETWAAGKDVFFQGSSPE
jgi:hypothetical protein